MAKSIPWPCYHVTDQLIELSEINIGGTTNRSATIATAPPRVFKMGADLRQMIEICQKLPDTQTDVSAHDNDGVTALVLDRTGMYG
jgi:hypothetical protein